MTKFTAQEAFDHAAPERTGVLLVQLGTPEAPEPGPVRRYLREFLSDPRVVEIPRALWWPILNGIILTTRPKRSAAKYAQIWTDEGSPLAVYTRRQASMLRGWLGERGVDVEVEWAMRYGEPSVARGLRALRERNVTRLLVVPMYPQYSGSTTGSAFDALWKELATWRNLPEVRTVRAFHDFSPYLDALVARIHGAWGSDGPPDRLVMSFHGVPRQTLLAGDPYHCECLATGRLLAQRLGLSAGQYQITFQSRFGKARWLEPYTDLTLEELGRQGVGRVDVVCPGFVSDCLETLEEIAIEGRKSYLDAGGRDFRYIPCLNDHPAFVSALATLAQQHFGAWPVLRPGPEGSRRGEEALALRRSRALAQGASR